ncbi:flagellar basal body P-ring protein FlgI [Sphingomonas colocasiae]|uniref:Flagellar P-ring protein n=1 Tax=Sphingomonas colocasiae TaxID=1848973 RepID=A0ABS7PW07_9SPHN|nr:flagellar basal body P-ring protein FlgI [Sphingomonas colocasiae]MBY8825548.1 flagellar basal body P-ring protein FlgI [Sphingomonas colocasiae]
MRPILSLLVFSLSLFISSTTASAQEVPLHALGRFDGWRENALVGYGLVTGLAGSGDTRSNAVTRQALRNVLSRLGTTVTDQDISSRNVAVVIVTATLPASANIGDKIDATVSSIGDARSLVGGTLLLTALEGPDRQVYSLAQGALVVGGYQFDAQLNMMQRNHPTTGRIVEGATIERSVDANIVQGNGEISFLLAEPDFATAQNIAQLVQGLYGPGAAWVQNADRVQIRAPSDRRELAAYVAAIEKLQIRPPRQYRVVVNERTGTVVAGADVAISPVAIAQGDIRVKVETRNEGSQPSYISGFATDVSSLVISNTRLDVEEGRNDATIRLGSTTIGDLVQGLTTLRVDTRRIISVLQALKAAGALHADLVVQ